jgi:predicted transcriptional regulator
VTADRSLLLLSVRPRFAAALLDGSKTVEVRRTPVRIEGGTVALVYSTSPQRELVGAVRVADVITRAPSTIWGRYGSSTGLRRAEYLEYLKGAQSATALLIDARCTFPTPVPLRHLRARSVGFVVPQSYRFVAPVERACLLNGEARLVERLGA